MSSSDPLLAGEPPPPHHHTRDRSRQRFGFKTEQQLREESFRWRCEQRMSRWSKETAWTTNTIVAFCLICFVWEMYLASWKFIPFTENPMGGPDSPTLVLAGAQITSCMTDHNQWWRVFSSQFLHAGVIHLVFNMSALLSIGPDLEHAFGSGRVLLIFVFAGSAAALSTAIFLPTRVCVGASGAILGLFGAQVRGEARVARPSAHSGMARQRTNSSQAAGLLRSLLSTLLSLCSGRTS
jgi:membrane associated rhomboid family serine protease